MPRVSRPAARVRLEPWLASILRGRSPCSSPCRRDKPRTLTILWIAGLFRSHRFQLIQGLCFEVSSSDHWTGFQANDKASVRTRVSRCCSDAPLRTSVALAASRGHVIGCDRGRRQSLHGARWCVRRRRRSRREGRAACASPAGHSGEGRALREHLHPKTLVFCRTSACRQSSCTPRENCRFEYFDTLQRRCVGLRTDRNCNKNIVTYVSSSAPTACRFFHIAIFTLCSTFAVLSGRVRPDRAGEKR